jgi:sulfur-carrier protein adenylyltransferase/sulfurtransferase
MAIPEISPEELKRKLDTGEKPFILDVRDPDEYQKVNLGGHLIPLADLPKRVNELNRGQEIVVHCKLGGRSAKAAEFLLQSGFSNVRNLTGGLFGYIDKVDPTMKKY